MPAVNIKSIHYQEYASRLYEATAGVGTDESEVNRVAKEIRSEIANQVNGAAVHGQKAVDQQNALTKQAMKHLGDAYAVIANARGNTEYVKGDGEATIQTILQEELSGGELALANRLYGLEAYTSFDTDDGWMEIGQWASVGVMLSPFALAALSMIPPLYPILHYFVWHSIYPAMMVWGGFASYLSFSAIGFGVAKKAEDWDPRRLQADAEYRIYG